MSVIDHNKCDVNKMHACVLCKLAPGVQLLIRLQDTNFDVYSIQVSKVQGRAEWRLNLLWDG